MQDSEVILLRAEYARKAVKKALPLFGATLERLQMDNRARNISDLRSTVMHILRRHTGLSLQDIGAIFKRDHTSVIHNVRKVDGLLNVDKGFNLTYDEVKDVIVDHLYYQLEHAKR
jgi:chromosomal replication initiation ATPase DnaA